jgi:hypothetical protein
MLALALAKLGSSGVDLQADSDRFASQSRVCDQGGMLRLYVVMCSYF